MATNNDKKEEIVNLQTSFFKLIRQICKERRKYLNYEIKTVSSATKISKEKLVNFENETMDLSYNELLTLSKFYAITLETILTYLNLYTSNKNKKEIKKKNPNLTDNQTDELARLVGFTGFKF